MSAARFAARLARRALVAALAFGGLLARPAGAQWVTTNEQFYLEASHNWTFRTRYAAADRLFNAFDYGHAILYETLWTKPNAPASRLEVQEYDRLTEHVLVKPPRLPLEEGAIEPRYAQLAPEAKLMFEWAHVLHRQVYDVLAAEGLTREQQDAEVARLLAYYKTRPDVAFSSRPKSMELMQEQPYSLAFRKKYPKFNGLIWAYHWLQIGLYEPLIVGKSPEQRQELVRATVSRFWQMLTRPVEGMPHQMPMTAAVAPKFTERYPEAAIIFDNLHSMHDVISDVLTNPAVPRDRKRAEILRAARLFRDDTSYVMPVAAWRAMAHHMGIENMGGPSVGFMPPLPTPTVTYGAVMEHDDRTGEMTGFKYGSAVGGAHAAHGNAKEAKEAPAAAPDQHAAHAMPPAPGAAPGAARAQPPTAEPHAAHGATSPKSPMSHATPHDSAMMQLLMRMLEDSVIRARVRADTAMLRLMNHMIETMPADHRAHMEEMMRAAPAAGARHEHEARGEVAPSKEPPSARRTPTAKKSPAAGTAPKKPVDPHAGHKMPPS